MERNERLKAADKCASKYTNENEAHIARESFILGCEFEARGEIVKGVVLETEDEHWKPSEEQMNWIESAMIHSREMPRIHPIIVSLYNDLKKL